MPPYLPTFRPGYNNYFGNEWLGLSSPFTGEAALRSLQGVAGTEGVFLADRKSPPLPSPTAQAPLLFARLRARAP